MNNFLKTAFVAAGVVGTVGAVSTAEAASFNVVVDKIEVFADGDDISTGITVFDPANNIGESATRTIDLFNASQKLGTALSLATPPANTYDAVLLHISQVEVSGTTNTATLAGALQGTSHAAAFGVGTVLALGNVGAGGGSIQASYGPTAGLAMQPTTVAGQGFTFPRLNIALNEDTDVTEAGFLTGTPTLSTISTAATNNADIHDISFDVDVHTAFAAAAAASPATFVSGTNPVTVGLFDIAFANEKPLLAKTISAYNAVRETERSVTFYDAPKSSVIPVAWIDKNNNGKLDKDEQFAVRDDLPVTDFDNINMDLASALVGTEKSVSGTSVDNVNGTDFGALDGISGVFGGRTQTVTVIMPAKDVSTSSDNNGWSTVAGMTGTALADDSSGDAEITAASAAATITVAVNGSTAVSIPAAIGADNAADTALIEDGEDVYIGLATSGSVAGLPRMEWTAEGVDNAGLLTISDIPLTIDALADGATTGTYSVNFTYAFSDADDSATSANITINADGTSNKLDLVAGGVTEANTAY